MKKFEYKVIKLKDKFTFKEDEKRAYQEKQLNEFGAQGWELVEYSLMTETAVFKREAL